MSPTPLRFWLPTPLTAHHPPRSSTAPRLTQSLRYANLATKHLFETRVETRRQCNVDRAIVANSISDRQPPWQSLIARALLPSQLTHHPLCKTTFYSQHFLWSTTNIDIATRARPLLWALARLAQLRTPLHLCRLSTRQLLSRQFPAKPRCRLCIPLPRSRSSTPRPQLPLFPFLLEPPQSNQFPLVAPSSLCLLQQPPPAHPSMSTRLCQVCPLLSHPQLAPVYQALVPQPVANRPNSLALPTRHSLPRVLVWPPFWGLPLTCCKRFATRSLLFIDNPFSWPWVRRVVHCVMFRGRFPALV